MTRFLIYPYTQNSKGAIALAAELDGNGDTGRRILREGSGYQPQNGDVIINWGASDCPNYPGTLNRNNAAVLNKLSFFNRLTGHELTPAYRTNLGSAHTLNFPVFCRTKLKGRDGAGIVVADTPDQLVPCDLYVEGIAKTSEYRIHVGRLPNGEKTIIGGQKKIHTTPHDGQDGRVWTGESTRFVWTVGGEPVNIPPDVLQKTMLAFSHFPELAFGAFDVMYHQPSHTAYVLEINSAPMMTPETAKRYGDFFRQFATVQVTPQSVPLDAPPPVEEILLYANQPAAPEHTPEAPETALTAPLGLTEDTVFTAINTATHGVLATMALMAAVSAVLALQTQN